MEWYSVADQAAQDRIRAAWPDASALLSSPGYDDDDDFPGYDTEVLGMVLDTAREQVIEFAPADDAATLIEDVLERIDMTDRLADVLALLGIDDDTPSPETPTRYVYAQLQQAKNLLNVGRVNSDGDYGPDGYTFTPRPLDKTVRTIIRPRSGSVDV